MKMNWKQIIFILTLMIYPFMSMGQNQTFENIFTKKEQITVNKIINFYDSIVLSRTNHRYDIRSAYDHYFDSIFPTVIKSGDLSLVAINEEKRIKFLSSLNQQTLKEIYTIKDSVSYVSHGKLKTKYSPYTLYFNKNGKYAKLLENLSKKNSFVNEYYAEIKNAGDFTPSNYVMIFTEYKKLNFGDRLQRLVIIINLLVVG